MRRQILCIAAVAATFAVTGCVKHESGSGIEHNVGSFKIEIGQVSNALPPDRTGETPEKPLQFPLATVEIPVAIAALDENGRPFEGYNRKVSFRVTPGRVVDVKFADKSTGDRMLQLDHGVGTATVVVEKVFGKVLLWAQDAPPPPIFSLPPDDETANDVNDAGTAAPPDAAAVAPGEEATFAAGVSRPIYFEEPTIADIQRLVQGLSFGRPAWDNKTSPLSGNFLSIYAPRPRGDMIVTHITGDGFFVTDLNAKRDPGPLYKDTVGTFGQIFVYTYSFPDGLYLGDRVNSITGTVQEFSGHTQLVFPSWVRVEGNPRPQDIPEPIVFDFSKPGALGFRLCKIASRPSMLDWLCAYSNNNIDIETIESALVKLVNVKPSTVFANCDENGNSNIPPFRYIVPTLPDGSSDFDHAAYGCDDNGDDTKDCECNRDCTTSQGPYTGKVCSETTNLRNYGQWLVLLDEGTKTRINVQTRDALPDFDPRDFALPEHEGCTLDLVGTLRQVQAARPRWMVMVRSEQDACCRAPEGKTCPSGIPACPAPSQ